MIRQMLDKIDALDTTDNIKRLHLNNLIENIGDDLRNKRIALNCK